MTYTCPNAAAAHGDMHSRMCARCDLLTPSAQCLKSFLDELNRIPPAEFASRVKFLPMVCGAFVACAFADVFIYSRMHSRMRCHRGLCLSGRARAHARLDLRITECTRWG